MSKVARRPSPRGGHGLFTTTAIPAGTQILSIPKPLVTIPDDAHLQNTCSNCLHHAPDTPSVLTTYSPTRKLSACLGCKVAKYCGKECQAEDWKRVHKHECKNFAKLPRTLPGSVRAAMRVLMQNAEERVLAECVGHVDKFQAEGKRWEVVFIMGKGVHGYSGTKRGEEEVRRLYCAVLVNSITLVTETFDPIGIAFDPLAASINHDCTPNAVMLFSGRALQVRALEDIPANSEVLISYTDNTAPRERRQLELAEKYFFTCACARCTSPSGPMDGFLCAVCGGVGIPGRDAVMCNKCSRNIPVTADMEILEQESWAALHSTDTEGMMAGLKALHKTPGWPLSRQPLSALHLALVQGGYIPAGDWQKALLHYLLVYLRLDPIFYPQRFHPVRVVHGFTLANLFLQITDGSDYGKVVWGLLCECAAQVPRSHGDGSVGFGEVVARKKEEIKRDLEKEERTREWVGMRLEDIGLEAEMKRVVGMVEGFVKELKR
ncbi:SET domain-containing protein [Choiromyces venosus 120613-1]|uniref:SET domain-containing protein n=1 Tax=Choiromyces venosus 120613-1 TaxID=1336337 RepID=A0A3N4JII4_9PEZI|nr:SET domain-containing protein [Choiromyces venosus 120613-1]